ncbi:MAG: GC-type dockerin domain-anchored protein [Planctomycetota bacterium]
MTDFFTIDTNIVSTLMEASPGIVPDGTPLDLDDCPELPRNEADIAAPFGILDLSDIDAFILAFGSGDAAADIAAPFGVIDLSDIDAFILAFFAGCP